jgi:cytochrome b6-f complex iron-sulfur subunit
VRKAAHTARNCCAVDVTGKGVRVTRRAFLKWLIAAFGAVSLAGVLYPIVRFLKPPASVAGAIGQVVKVGDASSFPAGQLTPVVVNGKPAAVQNLGGKLTVYSLVCTHLGCTVGITDDSFRCPCHGSEFSPTGTVTHGPATLPLPFYRSQVQNGSVLVGPIDLGRADYPAWYKGEFA